MDESTKGANGNCVLPSFTSSRPTAAQSYAIAGGKMKMGFEALSGASGDVQWAASFLAAQSVECLLKSFLSTKGFEEKELSRKPFGHNLVKLWSVAEQEGLGVAAEPPEWVRQLNAAHDFPYLYRYPMGLNGMGHPRSHELREELEKLQAVVADA